MHRLRGLAEDGSLGRRVAAGLIYVGMVASAILWISHLEVGSAPTPRGTPEGTLIYHPFSPIIVHPSALEHDPEDAPVPESLYKDLQQLRARAYEGISASQRAGYSEVRAPSVVPSCLPSSLTTEDRRFWADPSERTRALEAIPTACKQGGDGSGISSALERVDGVINRTLVGLGFPREEGISVRVVDLGHLNGQYEAKTISIDVKTLEYELAPREQRSIVEMPDTRSPDNVIATWIHESIHGRVASGSGGTGNRGVPGDSMSDYPGYEEGFTQGLTESICQCLGISPTASSYGYYVLVWVQLAEALGIDELELYRKFYERPLGSIHPVFVDVVCEELRESTGQSLAFEEREALRSRADELFDAAHLLADPRDFRPEEVADLWGSCVRGAVETR